jgi:protein-disulfide isomerase
LTNSVFADQLPAQLTPEQTQAIQQIVRDYILQNPGILLDALKLQQQRNAMQRQLATSEMIAAKQQELYSDPTSPTAGNPNGDVTIVEFFDYNCPYCKAIEPSLEELRKEDPKIRFVYKEFPILGPPSIVAAQYALAAQKQGKYSMFHNAMMATKGHIDNASVILEVARQAGVDLDRAKEDIKGPEFAAIIRRNYELAQALQIEGTPGIVIGKQIADGAANMEALRRMIATARQAD